jgi:glucokinase
VGVGLILDGRLHRGHRGRASELGHAPVEWGGEPCACGQRGCLEAYVGGAAWARRLRALAPSDSRVCALAGARERVTPEHVLAAAGEGDAFALAELERFNRYLARGITTLCFAVAPQLVVLGTIAVAAGERLCFAPLRALVAEQLWPALREGLRIVPSELGERLPYYAGVCVAREGASRDVAGEGSSEAVARGCETKTAAR